VTPDILFPKLAHILDEDHVDAGYVLRSSPVWDSLSILSIVSFVDESCEHPLHVSDLQNIRTAGELLEFLNARSNVSSHSSLS
jgi:acyl carrier protein